MKFFELITTDISKRQRSGLMRILKLIANSEGISRKDIAEELDLNKSSITRSVDQLIDLGIIKDGRGANSSAGRSPVALKFCDDIFYTIGIGFYKYASKIEILNANKETVKEFSLYKKLPEDNQSKCEYVASVISEMTNELAIPANKIAGIGIALPGIFDPKTGDVLSSSAFTESETFPLTDFFEKRFNTKCSLINISHLNAVIEHNWGIAKGIKDFITIDPGYGAGIFMNGQLCLGHQCSAGELGYMQISDKGPLNRDGRPGTLSAIAPSYKITDTVKDIIAQGGETKVKKFLNPGSDDVFISMVVDAIEDGDKLCAQLMAEIFEHIATAVVNIAYMFNPEVIILSDWTARCPECSIDIVRRKMGHYGVSNWKLGTRVESGLCNADYFAKGAALLPLENIFN